MVDMEEASAQIDDQPIVPASGHIEAACVDVNKYPSKIFRIVIQISGRNVK